VNSKARINILESAIYIVATPIGNLGDLSKRAIDTLTNVDLIAAEDTRHTKKLLNHLGINKELAALHDHNERERSSGLLNFVESGKSIALVSDAGTPLISDPGYWFVSEARKRGLKVVPVPGACAVIAALSASGLACDRFCFEGFLPAKNKARLDVLNSRLESEATLIFYESTHRIVETLEAIHDVFGERRMVLARELTKTFETFIAGTAQEVLDVLVMDANQRKGEFVLMIEGQSKKLEKSIDLVHRQLLDKLAKELPPKKASSIVAECFGLNKKALYQMLINDN